jgi:hypothetical protein
MPGSAMVDCSITGQAGSAATAAVAETQAIGFQRMTAADRPC